MAKDIDFIKTSPRPVRPSPKPRRPVNPAPVPQTRNHVRPTPARPAAPQVRAATPPRKRLKRTPLTPSQKRTLRLHRLLVGAQWASVAIAAVVFGYASYIGSASVAQATAGVSLVVWLLLRLPSVYAFGLAVVVLVAIPLVSLLLPDSDMPETIAVCAFLLLAVGVALAIRDYYEEQKLSNNISRKT